MNPVPKKFPIVCVGGSAGGHDAYVTLVKNPSADLGVAIVIVHHMQKAITVLPQILPRFTKMPVDLITEGLPIQPNRVFIIPANCDLRITIAQTPDTAEWANMPEAAIKTGYIDFVLSVEDIAQKIAQIAQAFPRGGGEKNVGVKIRLWMAVSALPNPGQLQHF